jgi:phage tail-like protein
MAEPAQNNQFMVMLDGVPLGSWMKVDGIKVSYDVEEWVEGGQNNFVHKLPGRAKYENITLTRPVNSETTGLASWFESFKITVRRCTGRIVAQDAAGETVFVWNFTGMFPVSWNVSGLDASGNNVLTETLVLAHEGFLP